MKVYDQRDDAGRLLGFEISNGWLGRGAVRRLIGSIAGVHLISNQQLKDGEFCVFQFKEKRFVAWEPFNDNSRYWIGPDPADPDADTEHIRSVFLNHEPARWVQVGRILSVGLAIPGFVLHIAGKCCSLPAAVVNAGFVMFVLGGILLLGLFTAAHFGVGVARSTSK